MGLLDQIGSMLGQGKAGAQDSSVGGASSGLLQHVLGMLSTPGALGKISTAFQSAGLGNVLQSWVGKGENLPISGDQVKQVLGSGNVADLGARAGLNETETSSALANMLPQVIDRLTPDGKVPTEGELSSKLSSLGQLFH